MSTLSSQPTLADLQLFIAEVCRERGWDKRSATEKMLLLTEEVGEVARAVRKELRLGDKKPETTEHLAEELVDVTNYILDIANHFDIDLAAAFHAKWRKNATRTWSE